MTSLNLNLDKLFEYSFIYERYEWLCIIKFYEYYAVTL